MIEPTTPNMEPKKKNWLYILSPCMLTSTLAVVEIVGFGLFVKDPGGYSFIAVIVGAMLLVAMVVVDITVKLLITKRVLFIRGVELIIILSIVFYFTYL